MRKAVSAAILIIAIALPAFAAKLKGSSTLKDSQPANVPVDKKHKNQSYDLSFDAEGHNYTCRTSYKKSMNATDFVVGSQINYEINNQKAKIKTPANKEVQCDIVRVAQAGAGTPAAQ